MTPQPPLGVRSGRALPAFAALVLSLGSAVLSIGCVVDIRVPETTIVTCTETGGCPLGWVCRPSIGQCVDVEAETTLPGIVEDSLAFTPVHRTLGRGSTLTLAFRATEPLFAPPTITIDAGSEALTLATTPGEGDGAFELRFVPLGNEPEGTWSVTAQLTDLAGNVADISLETLTFDFTPPELVGSPVPSPNRVGLVSVLSLEINASETLAGPPTVELIGPTQRREMASTSSAAPWQFSYEPLFDEEQSVPWSVQVALEDVAGNLTAAPTTLGAVSFDFELPSLLSAPLSLDAFDGSLVEDVTEAAAGTKVEMTVTLDELVEQAPRLLVVQTGEEVNAVGGGGQTYPFEWVVTDATPEGPIELRVVGDDDAANAYDLAVGQLVVDRTAPPPPDVDTPDSLVLVRKPWTSTGQPELSLSVGAPLPQATHLQVRDAVSALALAQLELGSEPATYSLLPVDVAGADVIAIDDAGNPSAPARVKQIRFIAGLEGKQAYSLLENPHRFEQTVTLGASLETAGATELSADSGIAGAGGAMVLTVGSGSWREARPTEALPIGRQDMGLAWDSRRGRLVLFGGLTHDAASCGGSGFNYCSDTWEFDGSAWKEMAPLDVEGDGEPAARFGHAMVFDRSRQETLLFGGKVSSGNCEGSGGNWCPALWTWDGTSWTQRDDGSAGPVARHKHRMVYDTQRGVVVMFGGIPLAGESCDGHAFCNDTWEWDGSTWSELDIDDADRPSPRAGHALAYDPQRQTVVMFGGTYWPLDEACSPRTSSSCRDLWELKDGAWSAVDVVTPRPSARNGATLSYDDQREVVLLYGGKGVGNCPDEANPIDECGDVWSYNGTDLVRVPELVFSETSLWPRQHHGAVEVPGRGVLLYGGLLNITPGLPCPDGLDDEDAGGADTGTCRLSDTWLLEGEGFRGLSPSDPESDGDPAARRGAALASADGAGPLLVGGISGSLVAPSPVDDSWLWTGRSWRAAPSSPLIEGAGSLLLTTSQVPLWFGDLAEAACTLQPTEACDTHATLNGVVWGAGQPFAGAQWEEAPLIPASGRPGGLVGLKDPSVAYDALRDQVVLFGGLEDRGSVKNDPCGDGTFADDEGRCASASTWVYSGQAWSEAATLGPPARSRAALAFDEVAGQVVLFGGFRCVSRPDPLTASACDDPFEREMPEDTWTWDGTSWTAAAADGPQGRIEHRMAWDAGREHVLLFGGRVKRLNDCGSGSQNCEDTWEWTGAAWSEQTVADLEGDGEPSARVLHTLASDPAHGEVVLFGGGGGLEDTWVWEGGATTRPAHLVHVDLRAAQSILSEGVVVEELSVAWVSGASSTVSGAELLGSELLLWQGGRWQSVALHDAAAPAPQTLSWSSFDEEALRDLVFDDAAQTLHLGIAPRGTNGSRRERAQVTTDHVEIEVRYRLP